MIAESPIVGVHPESAGEHKFVVHRGVHFHYVEKGEGEPVLFIHGFPENWFGWRRQIEDLSENFRVLALDMRGYGQSQFTPEGYDAETFAVDLLGILDALGIERINLVGHDWGAMMMWRFVFKHPERVRRVASLNTPHVLAFHHIHSMSNAEILRLLPKNPQFAFIPFLRNTKLAARVLSRSPRRFLMGAFRIVAGGRKLPLSQGELLYYTMLYSRPNCWHGPLSYYASGPLSGRQCVQDRDKKLDLPVLFLMGSDDPLLRPRILDPMRPMLSDMTVHHLKGVGHWPHLEKPDEVNAALARFFE